MYNTRDKPLRGNGKASEGMCYIDRLRFLRQRDEIIKVDAVQAVEDGLSLEQFKEGLVEKYPEDGTEEMERRVLLIWT